MKYCYLILLLVFSILLPTGLFAQDSSSSSTTPFLTGYSNAIAQKTTRLSAQLDKKGEKALQHYQKQQARILKKLYKTDSVAARNFSIVSAQKLSELQQKITVPSPLRRYLPSLDTVTTSLQFLKQSSALGANAANITQAISHVKSFTDKLKNGEELKQYLKEEKTYIKDQLEKFALARELKKVNKNLYYYGSALAEIKETIKDEKKIERRLISILSQTNMFQEFIKKNGMLAEMLTASGQGTEMGAASLTGLQTRESINQLIQDQVSAGGPNAQDVLNDNLKQGQHQLQQLKNKLIETGNKGNEDIMPEGFTPNDQKSKSFLKRLELNTNVQAQRANSYFPVAMDFGVGVGYRLSGSSVIGIGASYKMGLGDHIQRIRISHQGLGLRSYFDWKFPAKLFGLKGGKGSWWITGGYEQNHMAEIRRIEELKSSAAWKASGLAGISKTLSFSSKIFKGTKFQCLWDFLSYRQVPRTNPIVFRVGYNIR